MKRSFVAVSAAVVSLLFAAPALAGPAPAPTWTGFYVGFNAGGGWGSNNGVYSPNDFVAAALLSAFGPTMPNPSAKPNGVIGGLQLGYNWQVGSNFLIGAVVDFDGSGISNTSFANTTVIGIPVANRTDENVQWLGTVRGRFGFLVNPSLLAYATGGLAYGQVKTTGSYVSSAPFTITGGTFSAACAAQSPCLTGTSTRTSSGWTLGAGLEFALDQKWTVSGEYLYVSLPGGTLTETAVATVAGAPTPTSYNVTMGRLNLNIVRVALNYRF